MQNQERIGQFESRGKWNRASLNVEGLKGSEKWIDYTSQTVGDQIEKKKKALIKALKNFSFLSCRKTQISCVSPLYISGPHHLQLY